MTMKNKTGKTTQLLLMIIMTIIVALIMYQNVEDRNRAVLFLLLCYFLWNVWTMRQLTKAGRTQLWNWSEAQS